VTNVAATNKVEALKNENMGPPGPFSSLSSYRYSMSRTCGPRDIISLVVPKVGDTNRQTTLAHDVIIKDLNFHGEKANVQSGKGSHQLSKGRPIISKCLSSIQSLISLRGALSRVWTSCPSANQYDHIRKMKVLLPSLYTPTNVEKFPTHLVCP